ncbi:MAG: DUF4388 domain-containing protein [Candidatus Krumholzibacteriota bacterium]|nr:DUF4388 domain-containing protein [Candidatus Krumholzibacteriota bacterium]
MALEGNAKDFGLSEIFQLISIQKKSGMLSVTTGENVAVFFQDGQVISTRDRRNRTKDPLKDYLLRYGFITRDEMNNLQQIQAETNMELTEILLSEKYFSADELQTIFTEQIYETVQEVLSWPKSYYKFIIGKHVLSGVKSFSSIKVEGLLMESMRRIDEFPEMLRIFPHEDMLLKRLPRGEEQDISLEKNEEVIYELLQEELSLANLISRARMARFCTYESLKLLLEKELLEITRESRQEERPEKEIEYKAIKKRKKVVLPTAAAIIFLLSSYALGEYALPVLLPPGWTADTFTGSSLPPAGGDQFLAADLQELECRALETSLREGLEENLAERGSYPVTLEVLAVRKIIGKDTVEKAHQLGFTYKISENGISYILKRN